MKKFAKFEYAVWVMGNDGLITHRYYIDYTVPFDSRDSCKKHYEKAKMLFIVRIHS